MPTLEAVRRDALALSNEDRQLLAFDLAMSVDEEPNYSEACEREIQRRLDDLRSGAVEVVDWDEAETFIFEGID